jgi:hypothetical protein
MKDNDMNAFQRIKALELAKETERREREADFCGSSGAWQSAEGGRGIGNAE